jgi:hypothetical protein
LFFNIFINKIDMAIDNVINEELSRMKSLFGYQRGRVISEQSVVGTPNYGITSTTMTPAPAPPNTTLPDVTVKSNLTPRQKNINNSFCSVKNGVIVNPSSGQNNKKWADYVKEYSVTAAEIAISQKKCPNSGAVVKTAVTRKPDPKVMELQKQLVAAGYKLGTSGPNKDGVDGIMGPKTRAAQQQMIQQKGQQGLQSMSQAGKNLTNQFNKPIQLTPEQQANANAIKAGQPLPGTKPPTAPAASAAPVPTGPKPTGLGFANDVQDGWYYDAKTKDWYTEPQ